MQKGIFILILSLLISSCYYGEKKRVLSDWENESTSAYQSFKESAEAFEAQNMSIYAKFSASALDPALSEKTKKWKTEADALQGSANSLNDYINNILKELQTGDNSKTAGSFFISGGNATKLKEKIKAFENFLADIIVRTSPGGDTSRYSTLLNSIKQNLNTNQIVKNDKKVSWEMGNFHDISQASAFSKLAKLQNDVRISEHNVLSYLYVQIDASPFKFNKLEAIVSAESNYVLQGSKYEAKVFLAAIDTTLDYNIVVGGTKLPVSNGTGNYAGSTSTVGIKSWSGEINYINPGSGEEFVFPFKSQYQVGAPAMNVSATKMNVLYVGVDNPIDISVTGIPADKVSASISSGSLTKQSGSTYIARVKRSGNVTISASVDAGGQRKNMGSKTYRAKRIPDPVPTIAGKRGGIIGKNTLAAQAGLSADLENFDFPVRFRVVSFTVTATIKGFSEEERSTSSRLTAKQKNLIKKVSPGRYVYVQNIVCVGPDGVKRNIGTMAFKLK